jgi:hypothetical protein
MGQGFDIADPGGPPMITSMHLTLFTDTAVNYANTLIRVQFWDTYNSAANPVFSNPIGPTLDFPTGPVTTFGTTALTATLNFASPIPLTGLTEHGLSVNWQSDPDGTGSFADDTDLTAGLRGPGSADINPGVNDNPGSGYYRNASGETDLNFQSSDARAFPGVTNGGLLFDLSLAVPEPSSIVVLGLGALAILWRCRR